MKYYVLKGQEQAGPYSMDQLKGMWLAGQITSETPYWFEGLTEWIPLGVLVEDSIAEDKRQEQQAARITVIQQDAKSMEKPIGVGENIAISLASLFFTGITFIVGIIYCIAGKRERGVRFMAWSLLWFVILFIFFTAV